MMSSGMKLKLKIMGTGPLRRWCMLEGVGEDLARWKRRWNSCARSGPKRRMAYAEEGGGEGEIIMGEVILGWEGDRKSVV